MTPSELIAAVRAEVARIRELRAKGMQGMWINTWDDAGFFYLLGPRISKDGCPGDDSQFDMDLICDRVNSTETECELVEGLVDIACFNDEAAEKNLQASGSYGGFDEPGSVVCARQRLTKWLRKREGK